MYDLRRLFQAAHPFQILFLSALLCASTSLNAEWRALGPYGGTVVDFAQAADGAIYAALDGQGIYKTENRGRSWTQVVEILSAMHDLEIGGDGALYAATDDGLYRFKGELESLSDELPEASVLVVRVDPTDSSILYAGFDAGEGFYKSTDGGASWGAINNGFKELETFRSAKGFAFDPEDPSVIYAAIRFLYRSADGGASWQEIGGFFVDSGMVVVDPLDPQTIFWTSDGVSDFARSRTGGFGWAQTAFAPDPERPERGRARVLGLDPTTSGRLWLGTDTGRILFSQDYGFGWEQLEAENLRASTITALLVDKTNSRRVFAGTDGAGVFFSGNRGKTWKNRSVGLSGMNVNAVRVHPQDSQILYLASEGGAFRSPDQGESWTVLENGMLNSDVNDLVVDPQEPRRMYLGTDQTYYFSTNGGGEWRPLGLRSNREPRSFALDPRDPSTIYLGTQAGVLRSTNYGRNWQTWNGTSELNDVRKETTQLLVDENGTLTMPRRGGLMQASADSSDWSWLAEEIGTGRVLGAAQAPSDSDVLYAAVQLDDVYHSTDGGRTWAPSQDSNDLGDRRLRGVVVHPEDPQTVYAITWEHGVDKSVDGGLTWESIGLESESLRIHSLTFDPRDASRIYAATNQGVFVLEPK